MARFENPPLSSQHETAQPGFLGLSWVAWKTKSLIGRRPLRRAWARSPDGEWV
jgi:hypothetical protein